MSSVNWGALAAEAGDIQPVPVGKYGAICTKAELKKSTTSDNEYWATTWRITQEGPARGRTLFNNFVLVEGNPNALRAFFINMNNIGITQQQLVSLGTDKNNLTPLLVGRQAMLTINHREYPVGSGQMRENVERVERHAGGFIGNLSADAAAGGAPTPGAAPIPQAAPVAAPIPIPAAAPVPVAAPAPAPLPVAAPPVPVAAPVAAPVPVAAPLPPAPAPVAAPVAPAPPVAPVAPPAPVAVAPVAPVAVAAPPAPPAPVPAPVPEAVAQVAPPTDVPAVFDTTIAAPTAPPAGVPAPPASPFA